MYNIFICTYIYVYIAICICISIYIYYKHVLPIACCLLPLPIALDQASMHTKSILPKDPPPARGVPEQVSQSKLLEACLPHVSGATTNYTKI